ncbi:hypothetical protein KJ815_04285, partial [bacterium]|nr:hypothetical protein [bacterium]
MKWRMILKITGLLAALVFLAPAVMAQCTSSVPTQLYLGESACVRICPYEYYPAIELIGSLNGFDRPPILIFGAGCNPNTTNCANPSCTAVTVPELVFNGNQFYPNQWYGNNSCMEVFMYWGHDAIWWIEIWPWNCSGCFCITFEAQLDVEFSQDFAAVAGVGEVRLTWATASETDNDHFEIERDSHRLTEVDSRGDGATGYSYEWVDTDVIAGMTYSYTLWTVDINGHRENAGTVNATPTASMGTVTEYALYQNYPNPFNQNTLIEFDLVEP